MPEIAGYRELSPEDITLINDAKGLGETVGKFIAMVATLPDTDQRWLAIAKTDLQKGFMFLVRAIAKPEGF